MVLFLGGARSSGNMIDNPLHASHAGFFRNISAASKAAAMFFRVIHNRGLWLTRDYGKQVKDAALQFAEAYSQLAMQCHTEGRARYSLVPSFHYWHHFYVDAKRQLRDPTRQHLLSPSIASCEADEDFIGKISQMSRHVHPGVTNARTIDRYLVRMHFVLNEND